MGLKIRELEIKAKELDIPIIQKEALEYIVEKLNQQSSSKILEIGSAIGYSAILFVSNANNCKIETIEIDQERYDLAKYFIELYDLKEKITIHHADALSFNEDNLIIKEYDCLFIDAAKAQYQKFFEKYIKYVKDDGYIIVDNLDFHGMINHIESIKNRNTRQLVRKIKLFKEWIFNHKDYHCDYVMVGDGLAIIKRNK